ncbi:MAG: hypothetical protein IPK60_00935 [Sandaracinaceae bacterium]|nr:hypothetical protein [Sandaracinaceae bacterium]
MQRNFETAHNAPPITSAQLNAVLCSSAADPARATTCVADQLSPFGTTEDGRSMYIARSLPFGACNGNPYCTSAGDSERRPAPAAPGFEGIGGDYEFGYEATRTLAVGEDQCVPVFYWRVIVERDGSLSARKLARLCTQMSAGQSVDSFFIEDEAIVLMRSRQDAWTSVDTWTAHVSPFELTRETSYSASRSDNGERTRVWDYVRQRGGGSGNPSSCEGRATGYILVPTLDRDLDGAQFTSIRGCSASLDSTRSGVRIEASDPNAPRLLLAGTSVYLELTQAHDFDLLLLSQLGDGLPSSAEPSCTPEVGVQTLHYVMRPDGTVQAPRAARGEIQTIASARALPLDRMLVRIEIPTPASRPAEMGNPVIPSRIHVRVGDYQSWSADNADGMPTVAESGTQAVSCSAHNGTLTIDAPRLLESCDECLLGTP